MTISVYAPQVSVTLFKMVDQQSGTSRRYTASQRTVDLTRYMGEGSVIRTSKNLAQPAGLTLLATLLSNNVSGGGITQIGYGTNATVEAPANTALTGAVLQALSGAATFPSAGSVLFPFGCSTSQANGVAISAFGLLTAGGVLFARKTRPAPIYKTSAISFQGTWTITLEAP